MELIEEGLVIEKKGVEESLFPVRYHPKHASLKEELHAWAASTLGAAYAEDADKIQVALLASTYWPNTIAKPPRRILTLLKLMYWLFLLDDTVDRSCKDPSHEVNALHADQICNILLHGIFGCAADHDQGVQPHAEALSRIILIALQMLSEMRHDGMPPTFQARMRSQIITHLQSLSKEQLLNTAMPPSLEEYIAFNNFPRGTGILLLAAEYSLGIELSKEALASPLVKELQAATCDHLSCLNDIFSFEKELANKDHFMNTLYVLHMRNNAGPVRVHFEVAVSQAWEMIQRIERDCARLTHEILLSPRLLASSPGLHTYAENLCLITSGNWLWSMQVGRYKLPPQASLNAALKPFRVNALKPLPRIALLKHSHQFGRASVGMFVSPSPMPRLAIGK